MVAAVGRDLIRKLVKDAADIGEGRAYEGFPELTDDVGLGDLLLFAYTFRATVVAFLTPEELEEREKKASAFGLSELHREAKRRAGEVV
jgi:hypothetical protein